MATQKRAIPVKQLFDGPVREYSVYANQRAIPSLMDGFKPSQRKAIYGTLRRAGSIPETGIKVSQLAAAVSMVAAYHHGEASLEATIVGLAQDFAGANNLNYLEPLGQFGSRLSPTNAASRYIFTKMTPAFRKIFKREDDLILDHLEEDGEEIEPKFYIPILPNVLINGVAGMGTGFATKILPYNPNDLKKYILNKLKGKTTNIKLVPWYRGFTGTVERLATGQVLIKGKVEKVNSTTLLVSELPIGTYQDDYKEVLLKLIDLSYIKDYENRSTSKKFEFELTVPRTTGYEDDDVLMQKLKLTSRESENLTVWLPNGKLKCFSSPEELCDMFIEERVKLYEVRRLRMIEALSKDLELLKEKVRFINMYLERSQEFSKLTKAQLEELLDNNGFKHIDKLLEIRIYNLTKDQIDKLLAEVEAVKGEIEYYEATTAEALYVKDLEELDLSKDLAV
jgi:DNA topoisomerase-2